MGRSKRSAENSQVEPIAPLEDCLANYPLMPFQTVVAFW